MLIETKAISRKCLNTNEDKQGLSNYERSIYFICVISTNNSEGTAFNHQMLHNLS